MDARRLNAATIVLAIGSLRLRATHKNETSCMVLDTNAILCTENALSQNTPMYPATTIDNFSIDIQSFFKQNIINSIRAMNDMIFECWRTILTNEKFKLFVSKALSIL